MRWRCSGPRSIRRFERKAVVPAKAGTHAPCPIDGARGYGSRLSLRSAGTTGERMSLPRRHGDDGVARGLTVAAEIAACERDLEALASRKARGNAVRGGEAPLRAWRVVRARRADHGDAVARDALCERGREAAVEHVRRDRMLAHVERDPVREFVEPGEQAQPTIGGFTP